MVDLHSRAHSSTDFIFVSGQLVPGACIASELVFELEGSQQQSSTHRSEMILF